MCKCLRVHQLTWTCCQLFVLSTRPHTYREVIKAPSVELSEHIFSEMKDKKNKREGFVFYVELGNIISDPLWAEKRFDSIFLLARNHVLAQLHCTDLSLHSWDWLQNEHRQDFKEDILKIQSIIQCESVFGNHAAQSKQTSSSVHWNRRLWKLPFSVPAAYSVFTLASFDSLNHGPETLFANSLQMKLLMC